MTQDDDLVTPPRDDAIHDLLMETVVAEPERRQRRRRRRLLVWGSVGLLAAASVGIGAGVAVHSQSVSNATVVHCLSSAHRGIGGRYPDASATTSHLSGQARIRDARGLCVDMWRQGVFDPGYNPASANNPPGKVPDHLTVCVMEDGSAAVVPGDEDGLCQSIGLAPLKP